MYGKCDFMTADPFYYDLLKEYAKENRKFQTDAEILLWNRLSHSALGLPFKRQHVIGCYIADFVCLSKKLIIEVDGGYHTQPIQQIKDYLRTEDLNKMGFTVLRFDNDSVYNDLSNVLDKIFDTMVRL